MWYWSIALLIRTLTLHDYKTRPHWLMRHWPYKLDTSSTCYHCACWQLYIDIKIVCATLSRESLISSFVSFCLAITNYILILHCLPPEVPVSTRRQLGKVRMCSLWTVKQHWAWTVWTIKKWVAYSNWTVTFSPVQQVSCFVWIN